MFGFILVTGTLFAFHWAYYVYIDGYSLPSVTQPIEILNEDNEIKIGEPIKMLLKIDKPEQIPIIDADNYITCTDGNLVTLTSNPTTLPVGYREITSDRYLLPNKVLIGATCHFVFQTSYQVNPYVVETTTWTSEPFKAVE